MYSGYINLCCLFEISQIIRSLLIKAETDFFRFPDSGIGALHPLGTESDFWAVTIIPVLLVQKNYFLHDNFFFMDTSVSVSIFKNTCCLSSKVFNR